MESQYDFIMRTHAVHFPRRRKELAKLSGVSLDTLNKIFQRQTKNPKSSTVQLIYDVLSDADRKESVRIGVTASSSCSPVVI